MLAADAERVPRNALTSLVFPTFNPGRHIERTWREVERFLHHTILPWEVLFVCDGCTDGTPALLARLACSSPHLIRVLSYQPNRGKGYAVRHGLAAARGAWRLFTDVDLAYGFDDILRVAEVLREGAEVAIASRTHPKSRLVVAPHLRSYVYRRQLQSAAFSLVARLLLPLTQRDTQAGLKGLSGHAAEMLLPVLRCDGFGFDCELLTACARFGVPVTEVPVCVRHEEHASTTSVRGVARMVRDLWDIRRRWQPIAPEAKPEPAFIQRAA